MRGVKLARGNGTYPVVLDKKLIFPHGGRYACNCSVYGEVQRPGTEAGDHSGGDLGGDPGGPGWVVAAAGLAGGLAGAAGQPPAHEGTAERVARPGSVTDPARPGRDQHRRLPGHG